jgi:CHAT domain
MDFIDNSDCLDLMILNSAKPNFAIGFGRRNRDVLIAEIPVGNEIQGLLGFTERIRKGVEPGGGLERPADSELFRFGNDLFNFCFAGKPLIDLYSNLPASHIRLQFLTCHEQLKAIPWEFMQEPRKTPGPRLYRSIVRIVPSFGTDNGATKRLGRKIRVLFVASYPIDQDQVSWDDVARRIERSLQPFSAEIELEKCVPGTWTAFRNSVSKFRPDVVHFSGHGSVGPTATQLLFMQPNTNKTEPKDANAITKVLQDRGIRLVVLSACETSTMPRVLQKEYSVLAETLVDNGIGAVVASQLPLPDDTVASFVGPLYQKLLETGDIDLAVAEGRQALFTDVRARLYTSTRADYARFGLRRMWSLYGNTWRRFR